VTGAVFAQIFAESTASPRRHSSGSGYRAPRTLTGLSRRDEVLVRHSYFPPRLENIRSRMPSSEPTPRIFKYLGALPSPESAQPE